MSDVLVACQDLARADAAIALARVLVPDPSARWTVATVLACGATSQPTPLDDHRASHSLRVLRLIAQRAEAPPHCELRVLLDHRPANYRWAGFCDAERPSLAVVSPVRRRLMGPGVGAQLAATASVVVAMSPSHGAPPDRIRSVGVVFTTSPTSNRAVKHAAYLAAMHQANLRILAHPGSGHRRALAANSPKRRDLLLERLEAQIAAAWSELPWKPTASAVLRCDPLTRAVDDEIRQGLDVLVMPVPEHRARLTTARAIARVAAVAGCAVVTVPAQQTASAAPFDAARHSDR